MCTKTIVKLFIKNNAYLRNNFDSNDFSIINFDSVKNKWERCDASLKSIISSKPCRDLKCTAKDHHEIS